MEVLLARECCAGNSCVYQRVCMSTSGISFWDFILQAQSKFARTHRTHSQPSIRVITFVNTREIYHSHHLCMCEPAYRPRVSARRDPRKPQICALSSTLSVLTWDLKFVLQAPGAGHWPGIFSPAHVCVCVAEIST